MNIFKFFKRAPKNPEIPKFDSAHFDILAQAREDESFDRCVKKEGNMLYNEWLRAPEITLGGNTYKPYIPIAGQLKTFYYIFHDETARHKDASYSQMVLDEYKRLRAESNSPTPQ